MPVFIADSLEICDPVLAFDRFMEEIEIEQYVRAFSKCRSFTTSLFSTQNSNLLAANG